MSASSDDMKRSRRTPPEVGCSGKVGFLSYTLATRVTQRNSTKTHKARSAYRCGHCGQWHIGTDNTKAEKRKAHELKERRAHEK